MFVIYFRNNYDDSFWAWLESILRFEYLRQLLIRRSRIRPTLIQEVIGRVGSTCHHILLHSLIYRRANRIRAQPRLG